MLFFIFLIYFVQSICSEILIEYEKKQNGEINSKGLKFESKALKLIKKQYPPYIFNFSDDLYIKILECRHHKNVIFTNYEIKEFLSFGLPNLEPNENI